VESTWLADYCRRKSRKCRAILRARKSRRFGRTPWWCAQSGQTGLRRAALKVVGFHGTPSPSGITRLSLGLLPGGGRSRAKPVPPIALAYGSGKSIPAAAGLLGAFGLSRKALLAVALLAVVVWWYHQSVHQTLNTWETAVVVLALALVVAGAQTVFRAREALKAK